MPGPDEDEGAEDDEDEEEGAEDGCGCRGAGAVPHGDANGRATASGLRDPWPEWLGCAGGGAWRRALWAAGAADGAAALGGLGAWLGTGLGASACAGIGAC